MRIEASTDTTTWCSDPETFSKSVAPTGEATADRHPAEARPAGVKPRILDEAIVEEVSIDGMCGVY